MKKNIKDKRMWKVTKYVENLTTEELLAKEKSVNRALLNTLDKGDGFGESQGKKGFTIERIE